MSLNEDHSFHCEYLEQVSGETAKRDGSQLPQKSRREKNTWTKTEIEELFNICRLYSAVSGRPLEKLEQTEYAFLSLGFSQNGTQCMAKMKEILSAGTLKPGIWSEQEDQHLTELIQQGYQPWKHLAKALNNQFHNRVAVRNGKTVRERWNNYLNPSILRGPWSPQEDLVILSCFKKYGKKWARIAKELGNRTDGAVKNRFKSLIVQEKRLVNSEKEDDLIERIILRITGEQH